MFIKLVIILTHFILLKGCQSSESGKEGYEEKEVKNEKKSSETDFEKYISSLEQIKLPFKTSLREFDAPTDQSDLYKKFKLRDGFGPYGIAYQDDKYIVVAEIAIGDASLAPVFSVFTIDGVKTDSITPYCCPLAGEGFERTYNLILEEDFILSVIDSSLRFNYNESYEIIESSRVLKVKKKMYFLDGNGKILKK